MAKTRKRASGGGVPVLRTGSARLVLGLVLGIAAFELGITGKLGAIVTLAFNPNASFLYGWDPVQYYTKFNLSSPGTNNQSSNLTGNIAQPPPGSNPGFNPPPLFE